MTDEANHRASYRHDSDPARRRLAAEDPKKEVKKRMYIIRFIGVLLGLVATWIMLTITIWVILTKARKSHSADATLAASLLSVVIIMFGSIIIT